MAYPTSGKKMLNICILDILKKYTDCDHTMDQKDIIAKLKEDYDITVDRKSVKANLNCLVVMAMTLSTPRRRERRRTAQRRHLHQTGIIITSLTMQSFE